MIARQKNLKLVSEFKFNYLLRSCYGFHFKIVYELLLGRSSKTHRHLYEALFMSSSVVCGKPPIFSFHRQNGFR